MLPKYWKALAAANKHDPLNAYYCGTALSWFHINWSWWKEAKFRLFLFLCWWAEVRQFSGSKWVAMRKYIYYSNRQLKYDWDIKTQLDAERKFDDYFKRLHRSDRL